MKGEEEKERRDGGEERRERRRKRGCQFGDFWFEGCGPCLKVNGVVGVSMVKRERWKN